jgi:hypothetical protein
MSASSKEAHERAVFEEFARAAELSPEPGSAANEAPPKPDISCRIAGGRYLFELARLVDSGVPAGVAESIRRLKRGDERQVGGAVSLSQPLIERVREKTANSYDLDGSPVDLLLYYDNELPAFELPPPGEFREWAQTYMVPEIEQNAGPFSRFWVFNRNDGRLLWRYDVARGGSETM